MMEFEQAFLTASLTLVGGLILFILSQSLLKFILDPVQDIKKTTAEILEEMHFSANLYSNPMWMDISNNNLTEERRSEYYEAKVRLRRLSSRIRGQVAAVPFYGIVAFIFRLPTEESIDKAATGLIFLHNSMTRHTEEKNWHDKISKAEKDIRTGMVRLRLMMEIKTIFDKINLIIKNVSFNVKNYFSN